MLDADACYRALRSRDVRFDGVFYVGVRTTGIYCRPICPARTPSPERCEFFGSAVEAERSGFRACFRCRPELAPGLSTIDSVPRLLRAAASHIEGGYLNDHSVAELATLLGVTPRHLRRTMEAELGVTPVELAQTCRLALAKQLVADTTMPLVDVAFAAGFTSVRRFNHLFSERFGRPPSALRARRGLPRRCREWGRGGANGCSSAPAAPKARRARERSDQQHCGHASGERMDYVTLRLDYRPPFHWDALLRFLRERAIPGVEAVDDDTYRRGVALGDHVGWLAVSADPRHHALRARVSLSLAPKLMEIASRLRALFDLDARPDLVADHLQLDPWLGPAVAARPGLRVPGAFDCFELAVRAVLGQQVSVRAATTLSGRLVERLGEPRPIGQSGVERTFPTVERLASASVAEVRGGGIPGARAATIVELARAIAEGRVVLSGAGDPEAAIRELESVPGVGPWTAQYLAMRVLRWPDAFPAGDLAVRKALGLCTARAAEDRARAWRPWRAYAVMHLWSSEAPAQGG